MKVKYNSPVILSLTFAAIAVKLINDSVWTNFTYQLFALLPGMSFLDPLTYIRIFTHVLGHSSWAHLLSNFTFILLLGPILEEKYGYKKLLLMMVVTALATGILNIILFNTGLLGASGIVFMLILLSSFANFQSGTIPLTFILVMLLFLGGELFNSSEVDNISQFAHLLGGTIGTIFGFYYKR